MHKLLNNIFKFTELYKILRADAISVFPFTVAGRTPLQCLESYLNIEMQKGISVSLENDKVVLKGDPVEKFLLHKLNERDDLVSHSQVWYYQQLSKWTFRDLEKFRVDLEAVIHWLNCNDYMINQLPTEKFLQQYSLSFPYKPESK